MTSRSIHRSLGLALFLLGVAQTLPAQSGAVPVSSSTRLATRTQLDAAATQYDQFAASSAYSDRTRARARMEAASIRRRLSEGDFRVGDRIALRIDGQPGLQPGQVTPTDTITVLDGRTITVTGYRQISLAGVLRSELETRLRTELADYLRSATVVARPLMRVAIFGSVTRPGYVSVPIETSIDQLLSLAGGPSTTAAVDKMTLMRADTVLYDTKQVLGAVAEGRTLDGLGLLDGDALVVPIAGTPWDRNATLQIVGLFLTPLLTIFVLR